MAEDVKEEVAIATNTAAKPSHSEKDATADQEILDATELQDSLDLAIPELSESSRPEPVLYFPPPPARSPAPSSTILSRHHSLALSDVQSDPGADMHYLTVSAAQEPLNYKSFGASHLVKDATSFNDVKSSRPSPVVSPEPRLDRRLSRLSQDVGSKRVSRISQLSDTTQRLSQLSQDSLDLRLDHRLTFGGVPMSNVDRASATDSITVSTQHFNTLLDRMERTDAKFSALEERLNATNVAVTSMNNRMDQLVDLLQTMSTSISGSSPELPARATFEEPSVLQDDRLRMLSDQLTSMAITMNQLLANSSPQDRTTSDVRQDVRAGKRPAYPLSPPQEATFSIGERNTRHNESPPSVTHDSASVNKKRQSMLEMQKLQSARPSQMQLTVPSAASSLNELRLHPNIVKVLQLRGLEQLTSMQQRAIPFVLGGEDIIVQCPRGPLRITTHCVPIAQMIEPDRQLVQALIIAESPSTIKQIRDFLSAVFVGTKIIIMSADGKVKLTDELAQLGTKATCPHVVIATPQRSLDLIHSFHGDAPAGTKSPVSSIKFVVVDDLESILASPSLRKQVPTTLTKMLPNAMNRLTLSFASQIPEPVLTFAASLRKKTRPAHVLVKKQSSSVSEQSSKSTKNDLKAVPQFYIYIAIEREEWKLDALIDMLEDAPKVPMVVIWCKDDESVERVAYRCVMASWEVFSVQSQLGPSQREKVLSDFRAGRSMISKRPALKGRLLVVADGCALKPTDLHQVPLAVGYDLPVSPEDYVKRIACVLPSTYGRSGVVVNITTSRAGDMDMLKAIQEYTRVEMRTMPSNLADVL